MIIDYTAEHTYIHTHVQESLSTSAANIGIDGDWNSQGSGCVAYNYMSHRQFPNSAQLVVPIHKFASVFPPLFTLILHRTFLSLHCKQS